MPRILRAFMFVSLLLLAGTASGQDKRRVAILGFDDAPVRSSAAAALGSGQDIGTSLADVLVKELLKGGTYSIVERRAIDQVLKEQNFSNSNRADPKTAAAIGRVLGVQAIIIGSVTQFGVQESAAEVGSGRLGQLTRGIIGGGKRVSTKATVAMTARMVDTGTGEILTVASGAGESTRASVAASGYASGAIDMTSSSFQNTMLGEAVTRAAQEAAASLNEYGAKLAIARADYSGLVADVSGNTLIINVGSLKGVRVGDTIEITRAGRKILDPQTKKVLRTIADKIGTAKITETDDGSATAALTGTAAVQVGDEVRRVR